MNTITAFKLRFFYIIKSLSKIALCAKNVDKFNEADIIKKKKKCLNLNLYCSVKSCTVYEVTYASKIVQKVIIDLDQASSVLDETMDKLKMYRNDFESFHIK